MAKKNISKQQVPGSNIATREIGRTGLNRFGGDIYEEHLRQLQSYDKRIRVYKEMSENDPVIGAIVFAIDMLIRQVSWRVQAGGSDTRDEEAKEFLESCIEDMSHFWEDVISEILSFLVYGFSFHEIVYKKRLGDSRDPTKRSRHNDGRIGWRKLPIRAQDTLYKWEFDKEGGIQGMYQQPPPDYGVLFIPIEKALLFRTTVHKNNPQGRSILRNAYRSWYYKKRMETIEAIGLERDLAGYPVAYVPQEWTSSDASADQKAAYDAMKELVINIRRDEQEGAVLPAIYDEHSNQLVRLELLNSGGKRTFDTDKIIQRYDQRIAMTVLADFILLGHEAVGSFALSSSKTHLFSVALGAWLDVIAGVFNRHAIPRLFALNGFNLDRLPTLVHGDVESVDLKELGEYISKLAGAGAPLFPDEELENYLRAQANLPERPEE